MIVRVTTFIDLEVTDTDQAEDACFALNAGLEVALAGFPREHGEVVGAKVDAFRAMTVDEIAEAGYTE